MPTPQDFCDRATFRNVGLGEIHLRLDGELYFVDPLGGDAIQIIDPHTGESVAELTLKDGEFVPVGH